MADQGDLILAACSTGGAAEGLMAFRIDPRKGELTSLGGVKEGLTTPLYVTAHPSKKYAYVADFVKECDGVPGGAICAFSLDQASGKALMLNRKPARGSVPCYVRVTRDGKFALIANYGDGSVSVLPINNDGTLADAVCHIQHEPASVGETGKCGRNAHSIILSPDEKFAFAADLGIDAIFIYRFDGKTGQLTPHDPAYLRTAKKAGPRHLVFHPSDHFLFASTEYDNTIIAMKYDPRKGELSVIEVQPALPAGFTEKSYGADLVIHPNGRLLYSTNRGHDSIVIYAINEATGKLTYIGHQPSGGNFPRSIVLDSASKFLVCANEKADAVVTFAVDSVTGKLTPTGRELKMAKPASLWRV